MKNIVFVSVLALLFLYSPASLAGPSERGEQFYKAFLEVADQSGIVKEWEKYADSNDVPLLWEALPRARRISGGSDAREDIKRLIAKLGSEQDLFRLIELTLSEKKYRGRFVIAISHNAVHEPDNWGYLFKMAQRLAPIDSLTLNGSDLDYDSKLFVRAAGADELYHEFIEHSILSDSVEAYRDALLTLALQAIYDPKKTGQRMTVRHLAGNEISLFLGEIYENKSYSQFYQALQVIDNTYRYLPENLKTLATGQLETIIRNSESSSGRLEQALKTVKENRIPVNMNPIWKLRMFHPESRVRSSAWNVLFQHRYGYQWGIAYLGGGPPRHGRVKEFYLRALEMIEAVISHCALLLTREI